MKGLKALYQKVLTGLASSLSTSTPRNDCDILLTRRDVAVYVYRYVGANFCDLSVMLCRLCWVTGGKRKRLLRLLCGVSKN